MSAENYPGYGAEDLRHRLAELDARVTDMLRGWRGAPGLAHAATWQLWHRGTAEVQVGLSILAKLTAQANAVHPSCTFSEIDSVVTHLQTSRSRRAAAAHCEAHRHLLRGQAMMREALARLRAAGPIAEANSAVPATNSAM